MRGVGWRPACVEGERNDVFRQGDDVIAGVDNRQAVEFQVMRGMALALH
jgi:hypothetical protein